MAAWSERRLTNLLWSLPAVLAIIVVALAFHRLRLQARSISHIYWQDAKVAMKAKDFTRAEMLLDRVLFENGAYMNEAKHDLFQVLSESGRKDQAQLLVKSLAPDDSTGTPELHQQMAILLAETASTKSSAKELSVLHHHLKSAGEKASAQLDLAWGRYYIAVRDLPSARKYLESAAAEFPQLWSAVGDISLRLGDMQGAAAGFDQAHQHLAQQLKESGPDARDVRKDFVGILMAQSRIVEKRETAVSLMEEASTVLTEGIKSDPDGEWNKSLALVYVSFHELLAAEGGHEISELLAPLSKALEQDPNCGAALSLLMKYSDADLKGGGSVRTLLAKVVAEGRESALAHLALGNVYARENDIENAIFHFERAISINPKLADVMNNLAWSLAHESGKPNLERALGLINSALEERPNDASFLDTRGTILMKMGRHREALDDLEKSITGVRDPAPVHNKLAAIYQQLGKMDMANQHRVVEQEILEKRRGQKVTADQK